MKLEILSLVPLQKRCVDIMNIYVLEVECNDFVTVCQIVIFCMKQAEVEHETHPFDVQPEQQREMSVNVSVMTSTYSYRNTYEQLHHHFKAYLSNKVDLAALHRSPHLRLKKYKEAVYYGEYRDNKREGIGIMVYNSGQAYEGHWKNDLRHGQGFEKFSNGCIYEGEYESGKMHGQGKYSWPNGQVYEGEWNNNLKHGSGMWTNEKGDTYIGEWREGQANGFGVFTDSQGSRYEGSFVNFMKNGEGMEHFKNGDLYKGQYSDGKFDGFGQFFWQNGQYYKGHFSKGLRSGHGLWKGGPGVSDKYQGEFKNNKKEGYGIYTWACGNIYKGNYKNNIRSGYGEMYWEDGSFYRGSWQLDKQNGEGERFNGTQRLIKGFFIDGELLEADNSEQQDNRMIEYESPPITHFEIKYPTPITKIYYGDQNITESQSEKMKSTIPSIYRHDEARVVKSKPPKPKKGGAPLVEESFLRKKLLQTMQFKHHVPAYSIGHSQNTKKKVESRASSRDTVPHSAFQIHRIHRNRVISSGGGVDTGLSTLDDGLKFAFRSKEPQERGRYYSRLS